MHGMFTARRQARQHQSQRGVAVFPPTIVISITPLDRRGRYSACFGDRLLVSASRQPLLDAARELLRLGAESGNPGLKPKGAARKGSAFFRHARIKGNGRTVL